MDLRELGTALGDLSPEAAGEAEIWKSLEPERRAEIIIDRGVEWLLQNAEHVAPLAYVDPSTIDDSAEHLFGSAVLTLREAICATHRLLKSNPVQAQGALIALSAAILLATGIHPAGAVVPAASAQFVGHLPTLSPHIAEAVVVAFAHKYCS